MRIFTKSALARLTDDEIGILDGVLYDALELATVTGDSGDETSGPIPRQEGLSDWLNEAAVQVYDELERRRTA